MKKMSNYKGHIFFSFIFVLIILGILSYFGKFVFDINTLKYIPLIVFFGLAPDIDIKSSKISRYTFKIFLLLILIFLIIFLIYNDIYLIYYSIMITVLLFLSFFLKHRGKFHSILFALILTIPLLFLGFFEFLVSFLAYFGHLILDKEYKLL